MVDIPPTARSVNDLLKRARRSGLILRSATGQRFVLASIEDWEGFDVGGGDFGEEVKRTAGNKKLMKLLSERRSQRRTIPIAKVRKQLGID